MSGIVSSVGKVFKTVGSAVTKVGKAVLGAGAVTATAATAANAAPMAAGGLSGAISGMFGGGTIGKIVGGAVTQAGYGAILGGAVGALTGQGFGKGAMMGALGGAVTGGLTGSGLLSGFNAAPAETPSGYAPTGMTDAMATGSVGAGATVPAMAQAPTMDIAPQAAATGATGGGLLSGGLGGFLQSETGGKMLAGLGTGLMQGMAARDAARQQQAMAEAERDFVRQQRQTITDSYNVGPEAYAAPSPQVVQNAANRQTGSQRQYNRETGMIEVVG